jgi:hypothetical protein
VPGRHRPGRCIGLARILGGFKGRLGSLSIIYSLVHQEPLLGVLMGPISAPCADDLSLHMPLKEGRGKREKENKSLRLCRRKGDQLAAQNQLGTQHVLLMLNAKRWWMPWRCKTRLPRAKPPALSRAEHVVAAMHTATCRAMRRCRARCPLQLVPEYEEHL